MSNVLSPRRRFEIFKRDDFTCHYCGKKSPEVKISVDHLIAISNGGSDDNSNLVTACMGCNIAKGNIPLSKSMLEEDSLGNLPKPISDNKITVNLSVSTDLNEERKQLKATWRDLIVAGLHALKGTPIKTKPLNHEEIEAHLKCAVQELTETWRIIKEEKSGKV